MQHGHHVRAMAGRGRARVQRARSPSCYYCTRARARPRPKEEDGDTSEARRGRKLSALAHSAVAAGGRTRAGAQQKSMDPAQC